MKYFAQGVVYAALTVGFAYCVEVLFSPPPLVLAGIVVGVLAGMAYVHKKWN